MLELYRTYATPWNSWPIQFVNRPILSAILIDGEITFWVMVSIAVKDLIIADLFGVTEALNVPSKYSCCPGWQ